MHQENRSSSLKPYFLAATKGLRHLPLSLSLLQGLDIKEPEARASQVYYESPIPQDPAPQPAIPGDWHLSVLLCHLHL